MKKRDPLRTACRLTAAATLPLFLPQIAAGKEKPKEQPMNILFIMCDDHSYQTLSAYDTRYIRTPNLDRIARDGVRFTNSFVANSLSGPSRACMLTGKHSLANGFTDNTQRFDNTQTTFPKLLQAAGYHTAVVGKWHLKSNPTGFDYWNILIGQGEYYNPRFNCEGKVSRREGYVTELITDLAIGWLDSLPADGRPFCLLLHHKAPHRTWMPDTRDLQLYTDSLLPLPDNFYDDYAGRPAAQEQKMSIAKDMDLVYDLKLADKENEIHSAPRLERLGRNLYTSLPPEDQAAWDAHYGPIIQRFKEAGLTGKALAEWKYQQYMRDYLRVVHAVDRNVGRILDYLDAHGLAENTLVVYTSDQGFYMGEHGWFDKRFMYEESMRTPLLMRLPGGKRGDIEELVQNIDYAPTFLELAGVTVPEEMQGESLLPLLQGKRTPWRQSLYYHYFEYPAEHAVRPHYGVRTDRWKLIRFYGGLDAWELYDLREDPSEMRNLYGEKGTERITARLKKELERLREQYDGPFLPKTE